VAQRVGPEPGIEGDAGVVSDPAEPSGGVRSAFAVRVAGFEGPFDLLLALIAKHRIEVTALALHEVTDDFVAHIRAQGADWDLDETTSFLVIAATLLDLKAARLLPDGTVEDEEDVALLEARDLLFARLLQYRAFKEVSAIMGAMIEVADRRRARDVSLEPWLAALLPEVLLGLTPQQFAEVAAGAFAPKPPPPGISVEHVHAPAVSVREQAAILVGKLRRRSVASFRSLTADAQSTLIVVGRFLALLELYRDGSVVFEQAEALGELMVRWTGPPGPSPQETDQQVVDSWRFADAG
jgi:segregation and condensation protein A